MLTRNPHFHLSDEGAVCVKNQDDDWCEDGSGVRADARRAKTYPRNRLGQDPRLGSVFPLGAELLPGLPGQETELTLTLAVSVWDPGGPGTRHVGKMWES